MSPVDAWSHVRSSLQPVRLNMIPVDLNTF